MKEAALKEYIDRIGLVTRTDLLQQVGAASGLLGQPLKALIEKRDAFYCRFIKGQNTLLSRHLYYCLNAVVNERSLSAEAQELYDWLSEHEFSNLDRMRAASQKDKSEFDSAFKELQRYLYVAPGRVRRVLETAFVLSDKEIEDNMSFLWVTEEIWFAGLERPPRYKDVGYCLSEIRRLLRNYYSTREINDLLYRVG